MDDYQKLVSDSLDCFKYLKFEKQNPQHRNMVALYCSIVEYSDALIILTGKKRGGIAVPIILRGILEAFVDLKNLSKDPEYSYSMEYSHIEQWLRFADEARAENPFLKGLVNLPEFDHQVDEWTQKREELKSNGITNPGRFKKFDDIGMKDEYGSLYNELCCASHNNIRALYDRFLEANDDGTDFQMIMFKEWGLHEVAYCASGALYLQRSGYLIHSALETGFAEKFSE